MDKNRLERIRQKHPRAYEKWTEEEENQLVQNYNEGLDVEQLANLLQRQPGAIQSKLKSLVGWEKPPSAGFHKAYFMRVLLRFDWLPVMRIEDEPYYFPASISGFMNQTYSGATVYRWNIYQEVPADVKTLYIGEALSLCPNRLNGYLKPDSTQMTNQRLNSMFLDYLKEGKKILLEVLRFDKLNINGMVITPEKLKDKNFRIMIEAMLVTYYSQKNYHLLNL
ncbi:MAG: hypothetical protein PVF83_04030 [Anaerolineales bacterium]